MTEKEKPSIAFLGLGVMGSGMARRLLAAGYRLTLYNRNRERARPVVEAGGQLAESPSEAASNADVVISMVADDAASRSVWMGEGGALEAVMPGALLIESSTLTPEWVRELAAMAAERGCGFLDAPVTGTKPHAESGQLLFLVGGEPSVLNRAHPVLRAMGRDIVHLGPTGSGARMKLLNNFVCGVQAAALAEALILAERGGLEPAKVVEVLTEGAPGSPLVKTVSSRMLAKDYRVNFSLRLMEKDLAYAIAEGERHATPLRTAQSAWQLFRAAIERGFGEQDFSAIIETLRTR